MFANYKKILVLGCCLTWLCLAFFLPESAFSDSETPTQRKLVVGTLVAPPLFMKSTDGRWGGLSIEIWQAVAELMAVPFEFREYDGLGSLIDAIKRGEIDVIPSLNVEERYESIMDFSQSYLKSGLAIAVPAEGTESRWLNVVAKLFSKDMLKAVGLLMLMSLTAGILVWSFERRRNSDMFGEGTVRGIGHGIWWSVVTMSTVGYGDKAPKTIGGRMVAFVWMLFSIVFVACFTANITTSLTLSELRGKVRGFNDLYHARVGSISQSEGSNFLTKHGIAVVPFTGIEDGLEAVAGKKIDALVLNELVLNYLVKNAFPGRLQVIPGVFDEYFVSIALQQRSPLRKSINKALLEVMKSEQWSELLNRYMQSEQ